MQIQISPGQRFDRLVALRRMGYGGRWMFKCDCGSETDRVASTVTRGVVRSCGCLRREVTSARAATHGHSKGGRTSSEYQSWSHAKERCENPNCAKYPSYGGRGIAMHPEWSASFAAFFRDMGPKPPGRTLERIDNDGPYAPGNCRWATWAEQTRNTRNTVWVELDGKRLALAEAARVAGVNYKALHSRMKRGRQTFDAALAALLASTRRRSPLPVIERHDAG